MNITDEQLKQNVKHRVETLTWQEIAAWYGEESSELQVACNKLSRIKGFGIPARNISEAEARGAILEEMADTFFLLQVMAQYLGFTGEDIKDVNKMKLQRKLDREAKAAKKN